MGGGGRKGVQKSLKCAYVIYIKGPLAKYLHDIKIYGANVNNFFFGCSQHILSQTLTIKNDLPWTGCNNSWNTDDCSLDTIMPAQQYFQRNTLNTQGEWYVYI